MSELTTVSDYALKRSKRAEFFKRYGIVFLFLSPYLLFFALFCLYPLFYGIVMSLMRYSIGNPAKNEWRGFQNFFTVLFDSDSYYHRQYWYAMGNTVKAALILVPLGIIVPLIFALLVNTKPKGYKVFRAIIYLPSIFPVAASGVMFTALFGANFGYINQWIGSNIDWLGGSTSTAWFIIILLCMWGGWGGNFMILSAGLKNIDKSLYEAAGVDGCTGIKRTFAVTLPAIKYQLILCLFTTIIGYFGLYGQVYVLTGGGPRVYIDGRPYQSTMTIMWYLQNLINGKNGLDAFGMVSAMGLTLGVIIGAIAGIQLFVTRERKSGTKLAKEFFAHKKAKEEAVNIAENADRAAETAIADADAIEPHDDGGGL
ncbi:MAG: ABC transporter permease subunit [Clostridiales bacterium]|nr:ABC transporter permease subunit [Clostridiales bacterium]